MKVKGARLVRQIISVVRTKTDAMKARILVTALTVLSKKKTISAKINDAIDGIFNPHSGKDDQVSKAIVLYSNKAEMSNCGGGGVGMLQEYYHDARDGDSDDKYPNLTHTLFDEEKDKEIADLLDDPDASTSAIDIVKNLKENGENFNLEDEIDEVADLFITKFHKRMRLQKLLSFKRSRQMLERSA